VTTNLTIFALAAFFEMVGCFAFWRWLHRGAAPLVALLGIASLICFAVALTRVDSAFAGRAYAAYGGNLHRRIADVAMCSRGPKAHRHRSDRGDPRDDRSAYHHRFRVTLELKKRGATFAKTVPTIVPTPRQNTPSRANASQRARCGKSLKWLDLLGKSKITERQDSV
jgi:YnfA/UPF0060 family uncharacterized protein